MKWGITTGTCAALAAKAAALVLVRNEEPAEVEIPLPDGSRIRHRVHLFQHDDGAASATVIKDAGDDPDVTHDSLVISTVKKNRLGSIRFFAGNGVGMVTRAGLAVPPGEPAINPVPRAMICAALQEVSDGGFDVTISVPEGMKLAEKTFNPRLGIVDGISILGTTGRVRPFSAPALRDALKCALDVAVAANINNLVLVPGNMGNRAAQRHFTVDPQQIVDVSNEWGFILAKVESHHFEQLLIVGHPGKLGKLAAGEWQTHSAQSDSAVAYISQLASQLTERQVPQVNTVEELFMSGLEGIERERLGQLLATKIGTQIRQTYPLLPPAAIALINLKGEILGCCGNFEVWSGE